MSDTTVIGEQSLLDLAIQGYGTVEAVVQLALENDLSVTDELSVGFELKAIEYEDTDTGVSDYFSKKGILPATALSNEADDIVDNIDPCDICKYFK
ncbi:hypothetical protein [Flagellimonas eckloniae]|uniref:Uncharacterized protein n=1 Tax=Flagellimonas eckloniae TaxID=346185 RepID=A0A0Q0XMC0_9FLAO|nr:hypothetical protein [Allomuricauda eckloniae]KQC30172.1 hypothetical protein AAY42_10000 [Allomuricauda eckloniae]